MSESKQGKIHPLQIVGGLLAAAGLVLTIAPGLVYDPGPAKDLFATIERRIPWGGLLGLGVLLVLHTQWKPWLKSFFALLFWGIAGLLFARLVGLALDGANSPKQWKWVAIEAACLVVVGVLFKKQSPGEQLPPT